ncbi:MAG: hypothetical protein JRI44_06990 [Deltaproteobacteria bacterium]|nr:hypothetical protein [Deltaproteobacteria bacterium]
MIYFIKHTAYQDNKNLGIKKGDKIIKVFADSLEELLKWGIKYGLRRVHFSRSGVPHFDLWGSYIEKCKIGSIGPEGKKLYKEHFFNRKKF